jgi:hypothetical protein
VETDCRGGQGSLRAVAPRKKKKKKLLIYLGLGSPTRIQSETMFFLRDPWMGSNSS